MKKFTMLITATALSALILASCGNESTAPEYTVTDNGAQIITETTAKRAAAENVNLNFEDVQYTNISIDNADGGNEYDVEFVFEGFKYTVELDASTGNIINYNKEKIDDANTPAISEVNTESETVENEEASENVVVSDENSAEEAVDESSEVIDDVSEVVSEVVSDAVSEEVPVENSDIPVINNERVSIGEEAALQAALNKAELSIAASELEFCSVKLDSDKDDFEYDIKFVYGGIEYDVTVNAENGEIIEFEAEAFDDDDDFNEDKKPMDGEKPAEKPLEDGKMPIENGETPVADGNDTVPPSDEYMTEEEALQIALEHAQLTEADIADFKITLDKEHGKIEYEVEFISGFDEYDYDINAVTGEIRNFDKEAELCSAPEVSAPDAEDLISGDDAKLIAFEHAGVSADTVYEVEIELDEEKGRFIYELEFSSGAYEFEYDIDALSGEVIRSNSEIDD